MAKTEFTAASFLDRRTLLIHCDDERCGAYWDEETVGAEQHADGPTYIVVGCNAPDEKLHKLSARFGYSFKELQEFRDKCPELME